METIVVHAHGAQGTHSIRVPDNVVVYALSEATYFEDTYMLSHDFWHFAFSDLHDKLQKCIQRDDLIDYLEHMWDILEPYKNEIAAYLPGSLIPNVTFTLKDKMFQSGIFRLPLDKSVISREVLHIIETCKPGEPFFDSGMHRVAHPKYRELVRARIYKEATSLHDLIMNLRDHDKLTVVFVCACRIARRELPEGPCVLLDDIPKNVDALQEAYAKMKKYSTTREGLLETVRLDHLRFSQKRKCPESGFD